MIDYEKYRKSLLHLKAQYSNYLGLNERPELSDVDKEAIAESVIQRFETCYDTLWKDLKRYLIEELGLPDVPNSPKPILKLAAANGLLAAGAEKWLDYANARTSTAHDYSGEKAEEVLLLSGDFIQDATKLFETLTGTHLA